MSSQNADALLAVIRILRKAKGQSEELDPYMIEVSKVVCDVCLESYKIGVQSTVDSLETASLVDGGAAVKKFVAVFRQATEERLKEEIAALAAAAEIATSDRRSR